MKKLSEISTRAPKGMHKKDIKKETDKLAKKIGELQNKLYAENKHAILIVLQGMDASGKDGAVRRVFRYCSPSGINVYAFKKPTDEEFEHDFLWRVHKVAPRSGMIQIFNRSHYEDILIQRVHKWITEKRVEQRMQAINAFEDLLAFDNNTHILKFYMHISRERQRKELQERIDDPSKNWKHNPDDWKEAELWDEYMTCYEYIFQNSKIPWTIVPVDQRWYRDYVIAQKVLATLESLEIKLPTIHELAL